MTGNNYPYMNGQRLQLRTMLIMIVGCALMVGCKNGAAQAKLEGYDLANPVVHAVPHELKEISGIAFAGGNPDTVYAIQDEKGILYALALQQGSLRSYKFGKKGDYEDLAISGNRVVVLRSDGTLFGFSLQQLEVAGEAAVAETNGLLAEGEYESIAASTHAADLLVLCKSCAKSRGHHQARGFRLSLDTAGAISLQQEFSAALKEFNPPITTETVKPSAMAQHPVSGDWYVLCSVGKYLLVYTADWKPLRAVALAPAVFTQPEGMAFDGKGNLYISNEANGSQKANILEFAYQSNHHD
jgi:hypothetical protein